MKVTEETYGKYIFINFMISVLVYVSSEDFYIAWLEMKTTY